MEWDDFVLLVINIVASAIPLSISIWADAFYQDQAEISIGSQVRMTIIYIKSSQCKIYMPIVNLIYLHSHFYRMYTREAEALKDNRRSTKRLLELYLAYGRHCIHCESRENCNLMDRRDVPSPRVTCPQCEKVTNGRQQPHQNISSSHPSLIDGRHHEISSPKNSNLTLQNEK